MYDIQYTDFGMFLKKCFEIQLLSVKDSIHNYNKKHKRGIYTSDEKEKYIRLCAFDFDPYAIANIPGYNLLLEKGMYHPTLNPDGVCRDHILSKEYGWRNKISPKIVSHPANCQFLSNKDNARKGSKSFLTESELNDRIRNNSFDIVQNKGKSIPKTFAHRKKISETNSKYMRITNGSKNLRIEKGSSIPDGFRKGFTRKHKMVGRPGLEPGNSSF